MTTIGIVLGIFLFAAVVATVATLLIHSGSIRLDIPAPVQPFLRFFAASAVLIIGLAAFATTRTSPLGSNAHIVSTILFCSIFGVLSIYALGRTISMAIGYNSRTSNFSVGIHAASELFTGAAIFYIASTIGTPPETYKLILTILGSYGLWIAIYSRRQDLGLWGL